MKILLCPAGPQNSTPSVFFILYCHLLFILNTHHQLFIITARLAPALYILVAEIRQVEANFSKEARECPCTFGLKVSDVAVIDINLDKKKKNRCSVIRI